MPDDWVPRAEGYDDLKFVVKSKLLSSPSRTNWTECFRKQRSLRTHLLCQGQQKLGPLLKTSEVIRQLHNFKDAFGHRETSKQLKPNFSFGKHSKTVLQSTELTFQELCLTLGFLGIFPRFTHCWSKFPNPKSLVTGFKKLNCWAWQTPTCTSAPGKRCLHGTKRTWTCTQSTTCTWASLNFGME